MIDRRLFIHFDWKLLGLVLLTASIGIVNLYSATSGGEFPGTPLYLKQISWLLIGLAIMALVAFVDYHSYADVAYPAYGVSLLLLVGVLIYGMVTSGAQRWVKFGSISFQPSEFVKICIIVSLAKFFHRSPGRAGYSLRHLPVPFALVFVPMILILKQPDLGTAIILLLVFASILVFVKVRWSSLITIALAGGALVPILWRFLKEYQKRRILTFLNPDLDPLGAGYQLIQSKIAVGSGGMVGKGFMHGTQCKLGFLPEQQTDFIFSGFGEEWGLFGALVVVGLYVAIILWGLRISVQAKDRFGAILSFGVVAMLFWHSFINISMVLGMMPVVGIPLPLFSYGGSFLLSTLIGVGLLLNVSMRKYLF